MLHFLCFCLSKNFYTTLKSACLYLNLYLKMMKTTKILILAFAYLYIRNCNGNV
ncbi:hypothetical protein HFN_2453 [Helicobacter fennelliae MRY12-0050]|uniref:Uncharacterized protein n=1 Tax=Helicobacter fennelliae MRY12-0050 TaxID=1325130 RepID=T1CXA1_9HELI|nr:hypothetical protein HFN_2453 [Helicobacter fennelliae MRY12-0050]